MLSRHLYLNDMQKNLGINLTGGGARGSYQAGVLKALSEVLAEQGLTGATNPFRNFNGVSAGAINAAFCASKIDELNVATTQLTSLWNNISPDQVYNTDLMSIGKNAYKWTRDLTLGSILQKKLAHSLLNTAPLWNLVNQIEYSKIQKNLDSGLLHAISCSSYSYATDQTITFIQSNQDISWNKQRRYSKKVILQNEHIMASCAIPLLFPAIPLSESYYGDGSFRNTSPLSALIHLGSTKSLIIGVRGPNEISSSMYNANPGVAKVSGLILNALFFDTVDIDLERAQQINELIDSLQSDITTHRSNYTKLDFHIVRPSKDISKIAKDQSKNIPRLVKFLIGSLGSIEESSDLASYLLFVPEFTQTLVQLGYDDFYQQKNNFIRWLET